MISLEVLKETQNRGIITLNIAWDDKLSRHWKSYKGIRPGAIEAPLCFIVPQTEKPAFHSAAYTGTVPKVFFEIEDRMVKIADIREKATPAEFDREGFELLTSPTAVEDLNSDDAVENAYYPEIEALLKERFAASRVVIFDATRRSDSGQGADNPDGARGPATRVHVDYTAKSGPQRLKDTVGEAEGVHGRDVADDQRC